MTMKRNKHTKLLVALSLSIFFTFYFCLRSSETYQRWLTNYKPTFSEQEECAETKFLVYVKTHKTASSTVSSILQRSWNISFRRFPRPFTGGYPGLFNEKFLEPMDLSEQQPKVIAHHLRFDKVAIQALMPPSTKYVTIIRDPLHQFESAFNYYYKSNGNSKSRLQRIPCFATPYYQVVNKFNATLSEYIEAAVTSLNDSIPWYYRSRNYQSFDLGMDPKKTDDEEYIRSYIEELDSTFDLVMITEYFYESLVLLRQILCLDWDQLVFHVRTVGNYEEHAYTQEEIVKLRRFLKQDFILYDHMNKTFWKKVEAYGRERMENDIIALKERLKDLQLARAKAKLEKVSNNPATPLIPTQQDVPDIKMEDDELAKSDVRRTMKNMAILRTRIKNECPCNMSPSRIWQLAEYMADSGGYCPF